MCFFIMSLLNIFYSIYFNLRYLPFRYAKSFPFYVNWFALGHCKIRRGQLNVNAVRRGCIKIGFAKSPGMQSFKTCIYLGNNSKISFSGTATIAQGTVLRCDDDAIINVGSGFYCNCNCYIRSTKSITFGDNCSLGWNVMINSSDGHKVWHNGNIVEMEGPITIGKHVWLTSNCSILKNVTIPDDCIIANNALVNKKFSQPHCLIGGLPARIIKTGIDWEA